MLFWTVCILLVTASVTFGKDSSYIETDLHGTLRAMSSNDTVPLTINGINLLRVLEHALPCPVGQYQSQVATVTTDRVCTECAPCPNDFFRIGCAGASTGACIPCQECPANKQRQNCHGFDEGECIDI